MLRTFQRSGLILLLVLLAVSARAFSLWGPVGNGGDNYQTQILTYEFGIASGCPLSPGGYIGAPKNIGEEYRRNYNVIYYSCDQQFLDYFGATGAGAIDGAFLTMSNYLSVPQTVPLSAYSLNVDRINYRAQALGLLDVKSQVMGYMTEAIGLSMPERWTWCLRQRIVRAAGCPAVTYHVIQRNFDPVNELPSKYVNGTLYTYYINDKCPTCEQADALEVPVDPLAMSYAAVASHSSFTMLPGLLFTGFSRDDMGGFRYLMRTNNLNVESLAPNSELIAGGYTNLNVVQSLTTVDLALFASQARTNSGAALVALYPNLQLSSTSNFFVLVTTTNTIGNFTNLANSALTITNAGTAELLYATNDLQLLAEQSLTNTATVLSNLYPGIIVTAEIPIFTNVVTTNVTIFFTNYPYSPAITIPTLYYATNFTTNVAIYYRHTFANVVTNKFYTTNTLTTLSPGYYVPPYSVPGTFILSNFPSTTLLTNSIGGTFYILPTNVCAYSIVGTQLVYTTQTTNFGSSTVAIGTTNVARLEIRYQTNYIYLVNAVNCYGYNVSYSNTLTTNFVHTFDNVVTNISSTNSRVTILTTNITPCGGLLCTNITATNVLTNQLAGSIYILPTNQCGLSIVNTQFVSSVATTNFLISVTNSTGNITNQGVVTYSTNYVVLINPVNCTVAGGSNGVALRQGLDHISFVRRDFDSLIGSFFATVTNTYTLNAVIGNQLVPQTVRRIVGRPDVLISAADMGLFAGGATRTTTGYFNTANVLGGLAGPGTLEGQYVITFNKVGPLLINFGPDFLDEAGVTSNTAWASFDASTNAPIVYPSAASLAQLENQIVMQITTSSLPSGVQGNTYPTTTLAGSGGISPYTWVIAGNSASGLPVGLSLSTSGVISGTPQAGTGGTYDITIQITESAGRSVVREFILIIN